VNKFKARLYAIEHTQKFGEDYNEMFAPAARMTSIRVKLSTATEKDLEIYQFDVNKTFLYDNMKEEIYMKQPSGFVDKKRPDKVCMLMKSLYGIKHASRQWNEKINQHIIEQGFECDTTDTCIYYRIKGEEYTIMAIYVGNIIVMSQDTAIINSIRDNLKQEFKIKN